MHHHSKEIVRVMVSVQVLLAECPLLTRLIKLLGFVAEVFEFVVLQCTVIFLTPIHVFPFVFICLFPLQTACEKICPLAVLIAFHTCPTQSLLKIPKWNEHIGWIPTTNLLHMIIIVVDLATILLHDLLVLLYVELRYDIIVITFDIHKVAIQ